MMNLIFPQKKKEGERKREVIFPSSGVVILSFDGHNNVGVDQNGYAIPIGRQQGSNLLLTNIVVEKCPSNDNCVILKSIHGKYLKACPGNFFRPEFKETSRMNATPLIPLPIESGHASGTCSVSFKVDDSNCLLWPWGSNMYSKLYFVQVLGDTYEAFSVFGAKTLAHPTNRVYIAREQKNKFVILKEMLLSYECAFIVKRVGNGSVIIKPSLGGYLGLYELRDLIVYNDITDDRTALGLEFLLFKYVKINNNLVAFRAANSCFVRAVQGRLVPDSREICDGCVFEIAKFSASRQILGVN